MQSKHPSLITTVMLSLSKHPSLTTTVILSLSKHLSLTTTVMLSAAKHPSLTTTVMLSAAKHLSLTTTVMLSAAKHPSLINIAETLRQAQGDNTPLMPPGAARSFRCVFSFVIPALNQNPGLILIPYSTWMPDQVRHDSKRKTSPA